MTTNAQTRDRVYMALYEELDVSSEVIVELAECGNLGEVTDKVIGLVYQDDDLVRLREDNVRLRAMVARFERWSQKRNIRLEARRIRIASDRPGPTSPVTNGEGK